MDWSKLLIFSLFQQPSIHDGQNTASRRVTADRGGISRYSLFGYISQSDDFNYNLSIPWLQLIYLTPSTCILTSTYVINFLVNQVAEGWVPCHPRQEAAEEGLGVGRVQDK